jgi:Fe2+ or Zn2+ uptake regulation protein
LTQAGLVRQVQFHDRPTHYEIATHGDHHHIVCTCCGRIEELTGCPAAELAHEALSRSKQFTSIDQHALEFYGLCRDCAGR